MKILLVHDYSALNGGAEFLVRDTRVELLRRGHEVQILAADFPSSAEKMQTDFTCLGTESGWRTVLQCVNFSAQKVLRRALQEFQPDVVHLNIFLTQLSPLILKALRDVPTVYHAHWYRAVCLTGNKLLPSGEYCIHPVGIACSNHGCVPLRDWPVKMWQMRELKKRMDSLDAVVANSACTQKYLEDGGIKVDKVIWNGIPVPSARERVEDIPTVLFAGRLVPEKGVSDLLRAFAKVLLSLPQARLNIAGAGPQLAELKSLAEQLKIAANVKFTGHIAQEQVDKHLSSAWAHCVPSLWDEPFGNSAAEAMLRGVAVVTSNRGGPSEFVEDGKTGFLTPPGDGDALADALIKLLSSRELATEMGMAAREFAVQHLSLERYVNQFEEVYSAVVTT